MAALVMIAGLLVSADPIRYIPFPANRGDTAAVVVGSVPLAHTELVVAKPQGDVGPECNDVLNRLDELLRSVDSDLSRAVRLNVSLSSDADRAVLETILRQRYPGQARPVVTYVRGALPTPGARVAIDAVAVASKSTSNRTRGVAVLSPGSRVYVSGQLEKGTTIAEATRNTLASLRSSLAWMKLGDDAIVQVRSFLDPMASVNEVKAAFAEFYGADKVPPLVFVEWGSKDAIEIELIAASPHQPAKEADVVEYLTPPGMTTPTIYCRAARVHAPETIYLAGLVAERPGDGSAEVLDVFRQMQSILEASGSDFRHLVKATYFVSSDRSSTALNQLRPRFYDPKRPPAASKAAVAGTGYPERTLGLDMIAVPSPLVKEDPPERGHGLQPDEARDGWLSLFDGSSTFGWSNAKVSEGTLQGGSTTTVFNRSEVRAEVVRAGILQIGGKEHPVQPGPFTIADSGGQGPIVLLKNTAVRTLIVRPLGLKPILPDAQLTGWHRLHRPNTLPERRPTWLVREGQLQIQGGPGAIEYPRPMADLIVQAQVRSRDRHSHGGLFLRSIPGDVMNGYEVQIYSRCENGDPSRPAVYATGAIDDRQNARRLISRDYEWFTETAILRGPHLATWVNGYQTTDWTDDRPPHENPRRGLRREPGTLQIQAHDPATALDIRALSLVELDKP